MKKTIIGIICLGAAGCSTTPVSSNDAKLVQPTIKYQKSNHKVPLTIIRDKGIMGVACDITVYIDGEQVANLGTQEKVTAYVTPGETIIGAGLIGSGLCRGPERKERSFIVSGEKHRYFRVFTDQNTNIDILPSTLN